MSEDNVPQTLPDNVVALPKQEPREPTIYELFPELAPFFALTNKLRRRLASLAYGEEFVAWLQQEDRMAGYVGNIHTSDTVCIANLAHELMLIGMSLGQIRDHVDKHTNLSVAAIETLERNVVKCVETVNTFHTRLRVIEMRLGIKPKLPKAVEEKVEETKPE